MDINEHILSVPWRDLSCENAKTFLTVYRFRTAWAIRLKKIAIRSNGLGYPFGKEFVDRSSD